MLAAVPVMRRAWASSRRLPGVQRDVPWCFRPVGQPGPRGARRHQSQPTARRCLPRLKRRHQWCPRQSRPQASLRAGAPRIQAPLSMSARRQEVIRQSRLIVHSHRADRVRQTLHRATHRALGPPCRFPFECWRTGRTGDARLRRSAPSPEQRGSGHRSEMAHLAADTAASVPVHALESLNRCCPTRMTLAG